MARKRKKYPTDEEEINDLLQNMAAKASTYQTALGWTAPEVAQLVEDADNFQLVLNHVAQIEDGRDAFYRMKDRLFDDESDLTIDVTMSPIATLAFVGHSRPGINKRTRNLIQRGFLGGGYTEQIGDDLGWLEDEGVGALDFDLMTAALTIAAQTGGEFEYEFSKQGAQGMRIEEQDAEGNWQHAGDYFKSPVRRTLDGPHPRLIKTRGRHIHNNEPVGNYSPTYDTVTQP